MLELEESIENMKFSLLSFLFFPSGPSMTPISMWQSVAGYWLVLFCFVLELLGEEGKLFLAFMRCMADSSIAKDILTREKCKTHFISVCFIYLNYFACLYDCAVCVCIHGGRKRV